MVILKAISALLSYPQAELLEVLDDIAALVAEETELSEAETAALLTLLDHYRRTDLLELQQTYVELFDRGRALSLHLFEHIHGESRDRGQAMVDLLRVYRSNGFELAARELPDYLPLFLEYLAQRPREEAIDWLRGALPVLNLLGARLEERQSPYAALFDALSATVGGTIDLAAREMAAAEGPDDTLARMDEIWEEEAVRFMANADGCQRPAGESQPVKFSRPHRDPKQRRVG
ncbi:MAG: nitrate reductase molybdenum cofactor assembly chaperone [Pseudomonadota bacterium]